MRVILLLCTSLILYGIYIAGYRSMWAVTMILSIILAISSKNIKFIIVVLASFFIIYLIIPPVARERFALFTQFGVWKFKQNDG